MTPASDGETRRGTPVQRLGLVVRRSEDASASVAQAVRSAHAAGMEVWVEEHARGGVEEESRLYTSPDQVDAILALGGDGTFLRAARVLMGSSVPLVGVNLGYLGFLTSAAETELDGTLRRLAAAEFSVEERFTLSAQVLAHDGEPQGTGETFQALNDVVVHTDGVARVARLGLQVGPEGAEEDIGGFSGDGIIVATPTGSTAYSLSAGGPIVVPSMQCILVTPVCPHTLTVRPLVVPARDAVVVRWEESHPSLVLTMDGQLASRLPPLGAVRVRRGPTTVPLVRFHDRTFFRTLRRKLRWAARPGADPEA